MVNVHESCTVLPSSAESGTLSLSNLIIIRDLLIIQGCIVDNALRKRIYNSQIPVLKLKKPMKFVNFVHCEIFF